MLSLSLFFLLHGTSVHHGHVVLLQCWNVPRRKCPSWSSFWKRRRYGRADPWSPRKGTLTTSEPPLSLPCLPLALLSVRSVPNLVVWGLIHSWFVNTLTNPFLTIIFNSWLHCNLDINYVQGHRLLEKILVWTLTNWLSNCPETWTIWWVSGGDRIEIASPLAGVKGGRHFISLNVYCGHWSDVFLDKNSFVLPIFTLC